MQLGLWLGLLSAAVAKVVASDLVVAVTGACDWVNAWDVRRGWISGCLCGWICGWVYGIGLDIGLALGLGLLAISLVAVTVVVVAVAVARVG